MKIDCFSCTKMLYFAEKLLRDDYYTLPDINADFAKQFDMTVREIQDIQKQFEHDKLLVWEDVPTEIEGEYGDIKSEISYDALTVDRKKTEELIKYLKERYFLRKNPFISREAVASIVKQIKKLLDKDVLIKVVDAFSPGTVTWPVTSEKYTLIDLLFRCAYIKTRDKPIIAEGQPLSFVLAEFLSPIYYNIQNKKIAYQLFKYIDEIILTYANKKDYSDWIKEAKRYVIIKEQTLKEKQSLHKISLKSMQIDYDDERPVIKVGERNVALPPYKNEHYFCQAVFEYKSKEPISWDRIFDRMTGYSTVSGGKEPEPIRGNWQKVYDTMKRLNNRIKEVINTDDNLFSWREKMVIRNY